MANVEEPTLLDGLAPEVIENICKFLPTKDIRTLSRVSERLENILQGSPQLRLHFLARDELLARVSRCERTRKFVNDNVHLQKRLDMEINYFRSVPDSRYDTSDDVACSNFRFYAWPRSKTSDEAVEKLLAVACEVYVSPYTIGYQNLTVVIAENSYQAFEFNEALRKARFDSYLQMGRISQEDLTAYKSKRAKFFVCVPELRKDFKLSKIAGFVSFRKLTCVHDFLELESFIPYQTFHMLRGEPDDLSVFAQVVEFLDPHYREPFSRETRLEVRRGFYRARAILRNYRDAHPQM